LMPPAAAKRPWSVSSNKLGCRVHH
jgi:hypothetical protein